MQKKITITNDIKNCDYAIDNFNRWNGIYKTKYENVLTSDFFIFHELKLNQIVFTRIYKKKL